MQTNRDYKVDASPVKSFFVEMLTRDIELGDAILDLLDNCVDGVLRHNENGSGETPYKGYYAEITFDEDSFSISDNCGGIPRDRHDYAFRMGKEREDRDNNLSTVGVYGIGMKRAIFKIGKHCSISTHHEGYSYNVKITPKWIAQQEEWELPISESFQPDEEDGTEIVIHELNEGIATRLRDEKENFTRELTSKVETHYAFIFNKGFEVKINGKRVKAKPTKLVFHKTDNVQGTDTAIRPYIFKTRVDGVDVFFNCWIYRTSSI